MAKNTGKVREKSGNFVSPEKWEPCIRSHLCIRWSSSGLKSAPDHYVHGFNTHQNREI